MFPRTRPALPDEEPPSGPWGTAHGVVAEFAWRKPKRRRDGVAAVSFTDADGVTWVVSIGTDTDLLPIGTRVTVRYPAAAPQHATIDVAEAAIPPRDQLHWWHQLPISRMNERPQLTVAGFLLAVIFGAAVVIVGVITLFVYIQVKSTAP